MPNTGTISVSEATPSEAWEGLKNETSSVLIDVRTKAEWSFVGAPDLNDIGKKILPVEWVTFPDMAQNSGFSDQILDLFGENFPDTIYFICRSGVRSHAAANMVASMGRNKRCVNVVEGFEGDLNTTKHRGSVNGWKTHGLPWVQS